jgi:hypothetical protein
MLRQHDGTLLVNPGSVGLPFQSFVNGGPPTILPHAEYAIVESVRGAVSVELRRVPLDRAALRRAIEAWDNPLRETRRCKGDPASKMGRGAKQRIRSSTNVQLQRNGPTR